MMATSTRGMSKLCDLIVCVLPKLSGEEIEHVWSKMEEILERRRAVALRIKPEALVVKR